MPSLHSADTKSDKQEDNSTVILPPLVFPGFYIIRPSKMTYQKVNLYMKSSKNQPVHDAAKRETVHKVIKKSTTKLSHQKVNQ
jgi:hypothetical protein